jgi:cytochrome c biogenesis protein CcmG/thiol:disulfide interchange protein DsbE
LPGRAPCTDEPPARGVRSDSRAQLQGPPDAARWLDTLGDLYARTGADLEGRVAIDWGVYGVPETFVIDRDGRIAYKQIGPVTPEILEQKLRPLIAGLRSGSAAAESRRGRSQ